MIVKVSDTYQYCFTSTLCIHCKPSLYQGQSAANQDLQTDYTGTILPYHVYSKKQARRFEPWSHRHEANALTIELCCFPTFSLLRKTKINCYNPVKIMMHQKQVTNFAVDFLS